MLERVTRDPDASVAAGRLAQLVIPRKVPAGALSFQHTRFPHSFEEAVED
ncbi:MAG TPA: hypothetical protein VF155_00895 [Candidatus Dormibacteraeota bacterium]